MAPKKLAMKRVGVTTKRVNHSNAQMTAKPHGLPIPKHPADILREKGPGAQESSDSGEGSLPPDADELLAEIESPVSPPPKGQEAFPEKRLHRLPTEKTHSRPVSVQDSRPAADEPTEPQPTEIESAELQEPRSEEP